MMNLTVPDAIAAAQVILNEAHGNRELAEKAIRAARNKPDGITWNLPRALEFVRVFQRWPIAKMYLEKTAAQA